MESAWCVIVGAGFAGASTAYHLARKGAEDVLFLEQETQPGIHSSGRNAAMIRQVIDVPAVAEMARKGGAAIRGLREEWGTEVPYQRNGSLLLGRGRDWDTLQRMASEATTAGLLVEPVPPDEAVRRVPVLEGTDFDGAIFTPSDGVVDLAPLLEGYLSGARRGGVTLRLDCPVRGLSRLSDGDWAVETPEGEVRARVVVNASGAWAGEVGRMAGARISPFRPARRHLFFTGPLPWVDNGWPFVWDLSSALYFRPETGGLLVSPCDEGDEVPGIPPTDPEAEHLLARKFSEHLPGMPDFPIARGWAGIRTLTTDGHFVIGWDPDVDGLFWVAGVGGHGVTCSYPVGEMAAASILFGPSEDVGPFGPGRFRDQG